MNKKIGVKMSEVPPTTKAPFFLFLYLVIYNKSFSEISLRSISFNVISILTGTGYVTQSFDGWGNFPLIFFLILMFIGGCAGSTTCGIKIFRLQMLLILLTVWMDLLLVWFPYR